MNKQIILYVEGNIGAGKTTLLQLLSEKLRTQTLKEPLEIWLNTVDKSGNNILQHFYQNKKENGYMFQSFALMTRIQQFDQIDPNEKIVVLERSINSDIKIFSNQLYMAGEINEMQWKVLNETFNYYTQHIPNQKQEIIYIYLQCPPEICLQRIQKRNRKEEQNITLDYLSILHDLHERWLSSEKNTLVIDASTNFKDDLKVLNDIITKIINLIP